MTINSKLLLDNINKSPAVFVGKNKSEHTLKDVHRTLIAGGIIPLQGNYKKLPALLSTMSTARMLSPGSRMALLIDDDNISDKQFQALRSLAQDRSWGRSSIPEYVTLVVVSQVSPSRARAIMGDSIAIQARRRDVEMHQAYG